MGLATDTPPKRVQKVLQKFVLLLLRGHRKKGTEKRPESLTFEGVSSRQPPLSANPFSKLLISVEESPNRNCFGIHLLTFLCVMVDREREVKHGIRALV